MTVAYQHILDYVASNRWAVDVKYFETGMDILNRHMSGDKPTVEEIQQVTSAKVAKGSEGREYTVQRDGTAVIPVSGVIAKYMRMVNGSSQPRGTSIEWMTKQLNHALISEDVKRIFLHIESPGGSVEGLADFADEVYYASSKKPVIAFCDDLCCSAAYWIGSQACALYANQTAWVGSIGVYMVMVDSSRRAENEGFKVHLIRSGSNKGVGVNGTPVTDENLSVLQDTVNDDYDMFLTAILRGRQAKGLTPDTLRSAADGRHYSASRSLELKLIDGIMPFKKALKQAAQPRVSSKRAAGPSADHDTDVKNDKLLGDHTMSENNETPTPAVDVEKVKADAAAAASAENTQRLADLKAAFPNDLAFAVEQFEKGATVDKAKSAYCDVLAAQNAELADQLEKKTQVAAKQDGVAPIDSVSEGGESAGTGDFVAQAAAMARDQKLKLSDAMSTLASEQPALYNAYLKKCRSRQVKETDDE